MAGKSYLRITKNAFSNRNILANALTTSVFSLVEHGWRPFWNLYLKTELNASIPALGLLAMIQSYERPLSSPPSAVNSNQEANSFLSPCTDASHRPRIMTTIKDILRL